MLVAIVCMTGPMFAAVGCMTGSHACCNWIKTVPLPVAVGCMTASCGCWVYDHVLFLLMIDRRGVV